MNKHYASISIVTPSYNQSHYIETTIQSVLNQNYPNLEYVIIDGGSTDGSVDVIDSYSKHLKYWVSEPDRGHGHALNKGFKHTSGEIMAWLNSDDMYFPWTFDIVSEIFMTFPEVNWIIGTNSACDENGRLIYVNNEYKNIYDFLLGNFGWIQQESVFWRRSLWEQAGATINEDYKLMVDGELWCRFFLLSRLYNVKSLLAAYRVHDKNRAREFHQECVKEMERAIVKMKTQCPVKVMNNYFKLKRINFLKKGILKYLPLKEIAFKIFQNTFDKIKYDQIQRRGNEWKKGNEDFYLK